MTVSPNRSRPRLPRGGRIVLVVAAGAGLFASRAARAEDAASLPRVYSLSEATAEALRLHPTLRQARANVGVAEARVEEARAPQLPQVTATALAEKTTGNFAPRPGATQITGGAGTWNGSLYNYYSAGVTATQLIWDFGQTPERWRAARINREASEFSAHAAETQVVSTVRQAYFQARAQKDLVTVAADAVANQEKHLAQTEGLVGQGLRPEIDRARARTDLANARVQLVSARNADANAHAVLAEAIGLPAGQAVEVGNDELGPLPEEDAPLTKLVDTALQDRPEVASFQRQRQAQEALIRSARGAYGPTLAAQAGASAAGIELNNLVPNWYVEGLLTWPLFQGGLTRGQVREAEATLGALVAQEDSFRLGVRVNVEQAALAVQGAKANLSASHEAVTNAREQLRLAEGRYAAGLGSAIELGDAQVAATQAAAQEVGNRYALATARAALAGALGRR